MARKRTITNPVTDSGLLSAIVRSELQTLENEIVCGPSIFGAFGGDGNQGAIVVSSATNVSDIDDSSRGGGIIQCSSFNLQVGNTLTVDTGWLFLGCTGTVTIAGIIDANGQGELGGAAGSAGIPSGFAGATVPNLNTSYIDATGLDKIAFLNYEICRQVDLSLAGGGGCGGKNSASGVQYRFHMPGGGAGGQGGLPTYSTSSVTGPSATATPTAKIIALTGGLGDNSVKGYSHFNPAILAFRGAGGSGGTGPDGVSGGNGGGVIYIECNELVFTGTVRANGANGTSTGGGQSTGGGGGGGGVILIRAKTITTNSGSVTVTAGSGGTATASNGGSGAAGFKQIIQVLD